MTLSVSFKHSQVCSGGCFASAASAAVIHSKSLLAWLYFGALGAAIRTRKLFAWNAVTGRKE